MAHPIIEDDRSGLRCTFVAPVFINFFYGPPTVERLDFLFRHEVAWVGALPHFLALSIIDPRVGKEINAAARARAKDITEHFDNRMAASITLIDGSGFFPALVRSVLAGIQLVSARSVLKLQVATSIDQAVEMLSLAGAAHKLTVDQAGVRAAHEALRAGSRTG